MVRISNIQRFSIHDGDGIRTTVFFKGCPLNCLWCHNPESIAFEPQLVFYDDRCVGCGACARACPHGCITLEQGRPVFDRRCCVACGACVRACRYDALELIGMEASVEKIVEICLKDQVFYEESGGGVTLSGGEVMAQDPDFLARLTRRLKEEGLNVAIDTSGQAPWESFEAVLPWVDVFLYDIKLMDYAAHRKYIGRGNTQILENLRRLWQAGAAIHLRMPLIEGVNATDAHIEAVIAHLKKEGISPVKISLLPYHSTGLSKLPRLGQRVPDVPFATPSPQRMEHMAGLMRRAGLGPVSIGG